MMFLKQKNNKKRLSFYFLTSSFCIVPEAIGYQHLLSIENLKDWGCEVRDLGVVGIQHSWKVLRAFNQEIVLAYMFNGKQTDRLNFSKSATFITYAAADAVIDLTEEVVGDIYEGKSTFSREKIKQYSKNCSKSFMTTLTALFVYEKGLQSIKINVDESFVSIPARCLFVSGYKSALKNWKKDSDKK